MTRPYADVIGDPIAHSKSPLIQNFWLKKLGIDAEYRKTHVRPDELVDYFTQRREDAAWRGCNVTIPHKVAVIGLADDVDGYASETGAANCILNSNGTLRATNTDCVGILETIRHFDPPFCLIGSGGAARAALTTLDPVFPRHLRWLVRSPDDAQHIIDGLPQEAEIYPFERSIEALRDCYGVINATPLGMTGQPPMPPSILDALKVTAPSAFVFDMVYAPVETELLRHARKIGRRTFDGLQMLVGQAAAAFELFFGQPAPREHDAELRTLLTA